MKKFSNSQLVPGGLLPLWPEYLPPLPALPPLPLTPLPPLAGSTGTWSSPCSPASPEEATTLTMGAWCHSFLLFIMVWALLDVILTASLACL